MLKYVHKHVKEESGRERKKRREGGKEGENGGDTQKYKQTERPETSFVSLLDVTVSNFRFINYSLDLRGQHRYPPAT